MSAFEDRVKKNVKTTSGAHPRVSARTEYTDADIEALGTPTPGGKDPVDILCDQSSAVCLVVSNYAVASMFSKATASGNARYIVSDSTNPTSVTGKDKSNQNPTS